MDQQPFAMSYASCALGVPSECYPMTFPVGRRSTAPFARGFRNGSGHASTRLRPRGAARHATPRVAILDSQSVQTTEVAGLRGYDAGQKVKGRKCHLMVDMMGLLQAVVVHTADL